jgi:hypothetical protein
LKIRYPDISTQLKWVYDFVFQQLVQVLFLIGLVMVIVMMRTTMLVVALMGVTVVDLMSRLLIAQSANVWEKILLAKLLLDHFVPAQ